MQQDSNFNSSTAMLTTLHLNTETYFEYCFFEYKIKSIQNIFGLDRHMVSLWPHIQYSFTSFFTLIIKLIFPETKLHQYRRVYFPVVRNTILNDYIDYDGLSCRFLLHMSRKPLPHERRRVSGFVQLQSTQVDVGHI